MLDWSLLNFNYQLYLYGKFTVDRVQQVVTFEVFDSI